MSLDLKYLRTELKSFEKDMITMLKCYDKAVSPVVLEHEFLFLLSQYFFGTCLKKRGDRESELVG